MKRLALVPALTCLSCFSLAYSLPAQAQSSVTLYGVIDAGLNFTSNAQTGRSGGALKGGSQYSVEDGGSGGISGGRWGLRVSEDLGGGLAAIATLESGFNIPAGTLGQGGAEFGRQAFVGLKSQDGTVTLGRQYDSVVDYVQTYSVLAQWGGYMASHPGDFDNMGNTRRVNNAVKFASRNYGGFTFGGMYSFGGVAGSVGTKQVYSLGGAYKQGPVSVGVAYLNARNPNFSFFGTNPSSGTTTASNNLGSVGSATAAESNPVYGGYASASTYQVVAAGAAYVLGKSTVGINYSNTQFRGLGDTTDGPNPFGYTGIARFNTAEINYKYQMTPALVLGVAYNYTRSSGANGRVGASYNQGSVGADYNLSKRTDVYVIGVYQHASGTDSFGQSAVASITGQTASASNQQYALRLGFRHRF